MTGPESDRVVFLPQEAMTAQQGADANAARERHLVTVATDCGCRTSWLARSAGSWIAVKGTPSS